MAKQTTRETGANGGGMAELQRVLALRPTGVDAFSADNVGHGWKRIYGGQVLAQSVIAASQTVASPRQLHSMHAYFLVGGTPEKPVAYTVDRLRDGGSFSTRQVTARQDDALLYTMTASFHADEPALTHAVAMPDVPPPEAVAPIDALIERPDVRMPDAMRAYYRRGTPLDLRFIDIGRFTGAAPTGLPGRQAIWLKAHARLPDEPALHRALLAYTSDFALVETALMAHGKLIFGGEMQLASLDHALWFHRPVRVDEWLLYALDSPVADGGRGYARGAFFTADGRIVASVCQELLMRPLVAPTKLKK